MTSQIEHGDDVMSTVDVLWVVTLDLTGHMIIWGGLFAHGDGSTGLMKVVFLLRPTDGHARVWCQRNTSFQDNHILGTTTFEGGV